MPKDQCEPKSPMPSSVKFDDISQFSPQLFDIHFTVNHDYGLLITDFFSGVLFLSKILLTSQMSVN